MNKFLFTISVAVIAIVASMFAPTAQAQTVAIPGQYVSVFGGGTNKAMALTTNAFFEIQSEAATDVAFFINFKYLNAVGAGDVNRIDMEVFRGIGGGIYESNVWQTISFAANTTTTTAASTCTNLVFAGIPAVRCRFLNLSTNSHATNLTVLYRPKTELVKTK